MRKIILALALLLAFPVVAEANTGRGVRGGAIVRVAPIRRAVFAPARFAFRAAAFRRVAVVNVVSVNQFAFVRRAVFVQEFAFTPAVVAVVPSVQLVTPVVPVFQAFAFTPTFGFTNFGFSTFGPPCGSCGVGVPGIFLRR